ncbi:hypothetical protein [Burkholderia perseverans]|uniref:hypothetical protein n=1 Tax=Burkholderia perseverans TaxID=2615214 RepID=UPI001FF065FF|nr:hypothetical protein [Burkholderia perseverans]
MQTAPGANEKTAQGALVSVVDGGIARRWRVTALEGTRAPGAGRSRGMGGGESVEQSSYPPRVAHADAAAAAMLRRKTCQPPVTNEKGRKENRWRGSE